MASNDSPMDAVLARALWDYDPETGLFLWRNTASGKAKAGQVAGTTDVYGYTVLRYAGKGYKAHRIAWLYVYGCWPLSILDHINQDKADNRIANLRESDDSMNQMNVSKPAGPSRSGIRGVSWFSQYGKWKASIMVRGQRYFLGYFDSTNDAAAAYEAAKDRLLRP